MSDGEEEIIVDLYNENVNVNENENNNEIDPQYEEYLQNDFQDTIITDIFSQMVQYIKNQALPICEYITIDDVEYIIENFL